MGIPYKTRLEARKRQANKLGKCFYHSTNGKGESVRLPFAKVVLDDIELHKKTEQETEQTEE